MSARERWAAADAAKAQQQWGMQIYPDERTQSAEELAAIAYDRGDALFQVDIPVLWLQGYAGVGVSASRVRRPEHVDVLGRIEAYGWRLEHMSSDVVVNGSTATKRVLANAGSTEVANHSILIGLYVFRRDETRRRA
jgi:hypothetical protein